MKHHTIATRWMVLVCLLVLGMLPAMPARAQQQGAVTLAVQPAFRGVYRVGEWFPVSVDVGNDGADVQGMLEWSFPGQTEQSLFQAAVELPRGARKRVTLYAYTRDFARNGRVRLLQGSAALAQQNVSLEPTDQSTFVVGVASPDATLLNSLNALQYSQFSSINVPHFDLAALPTQASAYGTLNVLFVHSLDTSTMQAEQRTALQLWVQGGGQLVVSGGLNGTQTAAGIAPLLPVTVSSDLAQGPLAPLSQLITATVDPAPATALNGVQPRSGAQALAPSGTGALIYRQTLGRGSVSFTTFDVAALRGWPGEIALWQSLITSTESATFVANERLNRTNPLSSVLRPAASALPSAGLLLLLLLIYLAAVGPLNYLILRRMNRLDWAWVSIPATVLLFSAAFYLVGFGLRGTQSELDQVAIVSSVEGQPQSTVTALVGLFSPRRSRYTMQFPANTLVSEARSWNDNGEVLNTVRSNAAAVEVPDVLIDVGSVRTLIAEANAPVAVNVQSTFTLQGQAASGEVRNQGTAALEDALVVRGNDFQSLGTVAPGAAAQFTINANTGSFPSQANISQVGPFRRQALLEALFQQPGSNNNDQGVYLLAWQRTASMPVQLNGHTAQQEGVTLYVVRLAGS